ncbi:glycosyltransferase family 2 protein [Patulibacter medicamentivorans]|uniref:glycosyltransferase family 2 protein n=1 Tax=Patulibacter medicamentivorans TaxID=1097667 RepID=UPI0009D98F71|nr:glycosyltransferase family 2 protein [Patulibacter medicamentivorans]
MSSPQRARAATRPAPVVEIVIVAYRGLDLLRACLRSIREQPPSGGAVVTHVVDNASGDGTADAIAAEFPEVILHRRASNDGFSVANNAALRVTTAPWVLVLNPDTELRPNVLDHLIAELERHPEAGVIGCRLERLDGTFDHAAKRSFPTPLGAIEHFTAKLRPGGERRPLQYHAPHVEERGTGTVDAINGAFMLIRREALVAVGLLDERYWMYAEDLDWCRRFAQAGWQVRYDGRVTAIHVKGGVSGSRRSLRTNWHFHRSMGRFYRKFDAGRSPWLDGAVYAGILARFALSAARSAVARSRPQARATPGGGSA